MFILSSVGILTADLNGQPSKYRVTEKHRDVNPIPSGTQGERKSLIARPIHCERSEASPMSR
jgi:hypothetical protein